MLGLVSSRSLAEASARIAQLETENRNYSDVVTNALVDAAASDAGDGYLAALEIASGQLSRAFASATVTGRSAAPFTAQVLADMGRALVESGEAVWYRSGRRIFRVVSYGRTVATGAYDLSLADGRNVQAAPGMVLHARWNEDANSGRGIGPLGSARTLRLLTQRLEGSLNNELQAEVGYLLPLPVDGDATVIEDFKKQLANLKGKIAVVETARGGWGQGPTQAPRREYDLMRLGPAIPDSSVNLFASARDTVLTACGYPVSLLGVQADGTAQREAWRRYLHGTVAPLGRILMDAAARAGLDISLNWEDLFASDISGRARAFQSLVGGGMSIEDAARNSGLLADDGA